MLVSYPDPHLRKHYRLQYNTMYKAIDHKFLFRAVFSVTNTCVVILMVMAAMHRCKVCSACVLESKTRRVLGTKISQHCTATLIRLVSKLGSTVEEAAELAKGFACQTCFRALEQHIDLTEKLKTSEDNLLQKLSITIMPPSSSVETVQQPRRK